MSRSRLAPLAVPGAAVPPALRQGALATAPAAPRRVRPPRLWVPDGYEPNYAYPLLIWLHDDGQSDAVVDAVMPRLSDRNFVAAGLRAELFANNRDASAGFRWSFDPADRRAFVDDAFAASCEVRRAYHVHSERCLLVGLGRGATVAAGLFAERPDWFGGLVAVDPQQNFAPALRPGDLADKRVLLARDGVAGTPAVARLAAAARPLAYAGADVDLEITPALTRDRLPSDELLRKLNHWLVAGLCAPV